MAGGAHIELIKCIACILYGAGAGAGCWVLGAGCWMLGSGLSVIILSQEALLSSRRHSCKLLSSASGPVALRYKLLILLDPQLAPQALLAMGPVWRGISCRCPGFTTGLTITSPPRCCTTELFTEEDPSNPKNPLSQLAVHFRLFGFSQIPPTKKAQQGLGTASCGVGFWGIWVTV